MRQELHSERTSMHNQLKMSSLKSLSSQFGAHNRMLITIIVYLALLLDNMLLTVIVPILPDYLASLNLPNTLKVDETTQFPYVPHIKSSRNLNSPANTSFSTNFAHLYEPKSLPHVVAANSKNYFRNNSRILHNRLYSSSLVAGKNNQSINEKLSEENGSIGLLLSTKAFVQLIFNPIVGNVTKKVGYRLPIIVGTFVLLLSSLTFAIGETYFVLLFARAIQGIGSACVTICGMSLVAQYYPEEDQRSKMMGIILGSIALGVLIGYPFGGFLYDSLGKSPPFVILSILIFINLGIQFITLDVSVKPESVSRVNNITEKSKCMYLLKDNIIRALVLAIWFSTSTMAILEPCLPIWLMQHLKPTKWQLGTVFIPDSLGYFIGTNFFGSVSYKYGQVKIACLSLLLVGISSILIPSSQTVGQLLLPHFGLGLGIGIIDASLVPLLATEVDGMLSTTVDQPNEELNISIYGTIYAIQQTSVSLAYCLAPLFGGILAQAVGFIWLMRFVGFLNIIYGPILVVIYQHHKPKVYQEKHNEMLLLNSHESSAGLQYKHLYNTVEIE